MFLQKRMHVSNTKRQPRPPTSIPRIPDMKSSVALHDSLHVKVCAVCPCVCVECCWLACTPDMKMKTFQPVDGDRGWLVVSGQLLVCVMSFEVLQNATARGESHTSGKRLCQNIICSRKLDSCNSVQEKSIA